MKKIILSLLIGLLLSSYAYTQQPPPCGEGCLPLTPQHQFRTITLGNCTFVAEYLVYYCPPPISTLTITFFSFTYSQPIGSDCTNLTPTTLIPVSFDFVVKNDPTIIEITNQLPNGGCIINSTGGYTAACWQFNGASPNGGGNTWVPCDINSCCIRYIKICKDDNGNIYTVRQASFYAIHCNAPSLQCVLFCDEN